MKALTEEGGEFKYLRQSDVIGPQIRKLLDDVNFFVNLLQYTIQLCFLSFGVHD